MCRLASSWPLSSTWATSCVFSSPAQRFQLAPHADVHSQHLADLPGHDRSDGLPHSGEDALVVRRKYGLLHAGRAVRDQHHRPSTDRRGQGALVGELLAHPLKDIFGDGKFVPLGPHLRQLLCQLSFEFVQLRTPRSGPFQQLGIHAPSPSPR